MNPLTGDGDLDDVVGALAAALDERTRRRPGPRGERRPAGGQDPTMGKQMEGDNKERRKKAREAREEGREPSESGATQGASKQRQHLPGSEDHETKKEALREGKQGGAVQRHLPS